MTNKTIQHTPGPWQVTATRNGIELSGLYRIGTGQHGIIADDIDNQANANLIAVAPEMLEALNHAAPWLGKLIASGLHESCVFPKGALDALDMVNKAIDKVEGRS